VPGHAPVLLDETLEALAVTPGGLWVDGTVGLGGHAAAVLDRSAPDGRLLGTDRDSETLAKAGEALQPFGDRVRLAHADFRELPKLLGKESPRGVLLDLGVNSEQLDTPERGFSFRSDGPLDMRLDRSHGISAEEVVNRTPERELADIIYKYGEEPSSRRIAHAIVEARRQQRITTTSALAALVRGAARRDRRPGLDPATRTFQALRIHVNQELSALGAALSALAGRLATGGRLVVIAFHSLEDREVKQTFAELARSDAFRLVHRKPVVPQDAETQRNPRARSARLRALERVA
jgi:16S rRNA (cytosine1402-N4)-methyltransferase